MTTDPLPAKSRLPRRARLLGLLALVVVALIAAAGLYYLFGRSTPAPVSLGSDATPTPSVSVAPTASPTEPATATTPPAEPTATATAPAAADDYSGNWTVDASIGSFSDFSSSFVGYRVQEELVNIGAATAVGRTPDVSGSLVLDGSTVTSVEITADLTTLQSDNSMRDGQLGQQGIETNSYPTTTFVLTEPIQLESTPADGDTFSVVATGDFTLHGVTRSVQIPLEARVAGDVVTVVGSLDVLFSDYEIGRPESMRVLSVADNGVMELQLHFARP